MLIVLSEKTGPQTNNLPSAVRTAECLPAYTLFIFSYDKEFIVTVFSIHEKLPYPKFPSAF